MKKIFTIGAIALAALATVGCNQELSVEVQSPASGGKFELRASHESGISKTDLQADGKTTFWYRDDQISVFDSDDQDAGYFFYIEGDYTPSTTAVFTGDNLKTEGDPTYFAVYPYDRSNTRSKDEVGSYLRIPFRNEQGGVPDSFSRTDTPFGVLSTCSCVAQSKSNIFSFRNVFGLLAIKVADKNVVSIELKGNDSEKDKFGSYYIVRFDEYGNPQCSPAVDVAPVDVITLVPRGNDSFIPNRTYYMTVPPMNFASGATFTLKYSDSKPNFVISTSGAVSVYRGKVHTVPALSSGEPSIAEEANGTFDFPKMGYTNGEEVVMISSEDVTLVTDKGSNSNPPKYYDEGSAARFYGGNIITLTSEKDITRVEFTFSGSETEDNTNSILPGGADGEVLTGNVWTGSQKTISFLIGGTKGHRKISSIIVGEGSTQDPIVTKKVAAPVFDPAAGVVESGTQVSLSCATDGASIYYSLTEEEPSTLYSAPIVITEAVKITAVARMEGMIDSPVVSASYTVKDNISYTDFSTIAELAALLTADAKDFNGHLTDAVVSFVPNGSNAIIKDATGSILYYKSSHGLKQGQTFTGDLTVKALLYNGLYSEITAITSDTKFAGDGAVIDPEEVTLANLIGNYSTYQNAYVKLTGLQVVAVDGKNITVDGITATYIVYTNYGTASVKPGQVITVVGTVTKYGETEEIKVWKAADLNVENEPASVEVTDITGVDAEGVTNATKDITIKNGDGWNAAVTPDGTVVTAASISGNVITYSVSANTGAARNGKITVTLSKGGMADVSATIVVSQLAAGTSFTVVKLTNEEIVAAISKSTQEKDGYADYSISSASGEWSVNANYKKDITYLQIRNKKGAKIVSPEFSSPIQKIVIDMNEKATTNRTLYAIPSTTDVPTTDSSYGDTLWADSYGHVDSGTVGGKVTMEFTGDTKSFILVVKGGATYIDEIEVYLK